MSEGTDWLDGLVADNVLALFDASSISEAELRLDGLGIAGVIGFSGSELSGALGILATPAVLQNLAPEIDHASPVDVRDWVGELANQALGRFKIGLLREGLDISLATPVVLSGVRLEVNSSEKVRTYCIESPGGFIHLWLDVETAQSLPPPSRNLEAAEEVPDAGDMMLF